LRAQLLAVRFRQANIDRLSFVGHAANRDFSSMRLHNRLGHGHTDSAHADAIVMFERLKMTRDKANPRLAFTKNYLVSFFLQQANFGAIRSITSASTPANK
jgi:hypothetical protein